MSALTEACRNGKLKKVQKLVKDGANLRESRKPPFKLSCCMGRLRVAKWIFNMDKPTHKSLINTFRWTCIYGHLHVAKWLLSIEPCVIAHPYGGFAFTTSCRNGRICVAKWLLRLLPSVKFHAYFETLEFQSEDDHLTFTKFRAKRAVQLISFYSN
jgi:hypothetical protein